MGAVGHTPGPWAVQGPDEWNELPWVTDAAARIHIASPPTPEDAHLIAAAPDLLEALEALVPVAHYGEPEGLTNCPRNPFAMPVTDENIPADYQVKKCDCGADEDNARASAAIAKAEGRDG